MPLNPLKDVAFHALSDAYAVGYLCGISALVAAVVAGLLLAGRAGHTHVT